MSEATKKEHAPRVAPDTARRRGLCSVLLHYAIARQGYNGLSLFHVPLGLDEEALVVFSSWQAVQRFFLSEVFSGECSAGELISLLLGPYEGIEWVLLDPLAGGLTAGGAHTNLISQERFVDHLFLR